MSDGGKGSKSRPFGVDQDMFNFNWDIIFGKKPPKETDDAVAEDEAFKIIEDKNSICNPNKQ